MPILTPQVIRRNQGMNVPPPQLDGGAPSTSAAPAPQPPQFAPPPPQNNSYAVNGPPAPQAAPTPYQSTGIKGAPVPGQTTGGPPRMGTSAAPPATPAPVANTPFGDDASYLNFVKTNIDSTISDDQWKAWKGHLDQGCPPNAPFRTERPGPGGAQFSGGERCVEKPDNCPEGFQVVGRDAGDRVAGCVPAGGGGGSPGGAPGSRIGIPGGEGGGGGRFNISGQGSLGTPGAGGFGGVDDALQKIIMGGLNNPISRYTPEAMATLLSGTKATAEDQSQQARDAALEDAAARGVLGGGATGTQLSNIRASANRTVAGEQQNIARAKIDADYQDKVTAIQQAQTYLDQARDWLYKQQMRGDQRQQFEANIALAYARLQQDWDQLQSQQGYGLLQGAF